MKNDLPRAVGGRTDEARQDGALGDLLAYGRQESAAALTAKDRQQYDFWQGWCAALERVVTTDPKLAAGEAADAGRIAPHPTCSTCRFWRDWYADAKTPQLRAMQGQTGDCNKFPGHLNAVAAEFYCAAYKPEAASRLAGAQEP